MPGLEAGRRAEGDAAMIVQCRRRFGLAMFLDIGRTGIEAERRAGEAARDIIDIGRLAPIEDSVEGLLALGREEIARGEEDHIDLHFREAPAEGKDTLP